MITGMVNALVRELFIPRCTGVYGAGEGCTVRLPVVLLP
jgi:hypothetical protein